MKPLFEILKLVNEADAWEDYIENLLNPNPFCINQTDDLETAIKTDDQIALRDIAARTQDFDFNQIIRGTATTFPGSDTSLIEYAAALGSINCFKFLLVNGAELVTSEQFENVLVAMGNEPFDLLNDFQAHRLYWVPDAFVGELPEHAALFEFLLTPLTLAGIGGMTDLLGWLEFRSIQRQGIDQYAILGGNPELIQILVQRGIEFGYKHCMEVALANGRYDILRWIWENWGILPVVRDLFMKACELDDLTVCMELIEKGFDLHLTDNEFLLTAATSGSLSVFLYLIHHPPWSDMEDKNAILQIVSDYWKLPRSFLLVILGVGQ
jgi:hypothetical protein